MDGPCRHVSQQECRHIPAKVTVYELLDEQLTVDGADVAARLGKTQPQIAPAAQRLERRAVISRDWGRWRVENRLLHRYLTSGDILP